MKTLHLSIILMITIEIFLGNGIACAQYGLPPSEQTEHTAILQQALLGSPLQQFQSGISVENISCKEGLFLAIKSVNKEPTCLKAGTISKLASRGFFYGIDANESETNYTTVLIPPGSENPSSDKTYSPKFTTIVLGINNTVRWANQAESANTLASDMPIEQNGKIFGSNVLRPGESYEFTFTEPGTFGIHGEPHPWQRGTITVLSSTKNTAPILGQNNVISGDFYQGIESNTGIVSIKNQTYYMMTATNSTYPIPLGMTVQFHQVTFSFPYGSLATPGGEIIPFVMSFPDGTTESYGKVVKNSDGSGSMSGIGLGPGPSSNRTITVLGDHMHPQAGVTMTENQIKLLVDTDVYSNIMVNMTKTTNTKNNNPFGITALVIYHPFLGCLSTGCPHNNFYLKINSNSTAYLTGYNICKDSCAKNDNMSVLLPINTILKPNYASIELPENLEWKDGDVITIQLNISSTSNETGLPVDLGTSTIVP